MSLFMKRDWLPLIYLCFVGAILFKACEIKFSNASYDISRSSRPEVFCKKGVLKNFTKFTGKHLCRVSF